MGISEKVCAAEVERSTLHQGDELRQIHVPPNDLIVCGREKDRMFLVHVATVLAPTLNDWAMTQNPAQPEAPFVNYFKSGWHAETRGVRDPLLDASDKPPDAAASGFDVIVLARIGSYSRKNPDDPFALWDGRKAKLWEPRFELPDGHDEYAVTRQFFEEVPHCLTLARR